MLFEQIDPIDIKRRIETGEQLALIDIRERKEWEICRIEGAQLMPMSEFVNCQGQFEPDGGPYVIYCHHGIRSAQVCGYLASIGIKKLINMQGGIDLWSKTVDSDVPLY